MRNLDLAHIETSGLHLIEASAGTGKTWTIAALYVLLLLENRLRPEEILVVTYTKAATAELRDRIRTRISGTLELYASGRPPGDELERILLESRATDSATAVKLLTRALYSFDDAAIFTIHGFCQRALLDNAFESGSLFDTEMITDQSALVDEVSTGARRISEIVRAVKDYSYMDQAPVQQVVETVMNAEQALQTAVAVRDKLLSAYQEITRMAI